MSTPQTVRTASVSTSSRRTLVSTSSCVEVRTSATRDLVREPARPVVTEPIRVAVAVEEVVDDLEEQPDLVAEGEPGRALLLRHPCHLEPQAAPPRRTGGRS